MSGDIGSKRYPTLTVTSSALVSMVDDVGENAGLIQTS